MPTLLKNSDSSAPETAEATGGFQLRDISLSFPGTVVLDRVGLRIDPGEQVALVGPSGAGKTTLLRLLNRTLQPSTGEVRVGDRDLATLSRTQLRRLRSRIGFIHQDLSLVPNVRVSQNVISGKLGSRSYLGGVRAWLRPSRKDLLQVHRLLERVGIPEKLFERTDLLSGGQQQRVAIARALFQEPRAILADEPISSVDPARARDTVALLSEICREGEMTLIMSLHNLALAREFFPRLVGIRQGRIWFDRGSDRITEQCFHQLYDLDQGEMMSDGA